MILMAYLSYLLAEVLTINFKCFLVKERYVKSVREKCFMPYTSE